MMQLRAKEFQEKLRSLREKPKDSENERKISIKKKKKKRSRQYLDLFYATRNEV